MSFSRRDLFWYCAGIFSVIAVWLLMHALSVPQNASTNTSPPPQASDTSASQALPMASSPPVSAPRGAPGGASAAAPPEARSAGSMNEVLERLEARLAAQGGSDSDWDLLAQSYEFVGRAADAKLARAHQLPNATGAATTGISAAAPTAAIAGEIDVAGTLKSKLPAGLTLFIVAKAVDSPGPPVAIVRTMTGSWPLSFKLDDSNAMLPGRNLSSAQRVSIEARATRSGMAAPQSGDFQSTIVTVDPRASSPVRIVIDHVIG